MARARSATRFSRRALALVALCLLLVSPVAAKKKKALVEPETRVRAAGDGKRRLIDAGDHRHDREDGPVTHAQHLCPCVCPCAAEPLIVQLMLTLICKVRLSAARVHRQRCADRWWDFGGSAIVNTAKCARSRFDRAQSADTFA